MIQKLLFLLFLMGGCAFPQAVNYQNVSSTTNSACAPGALCPILAIPGATVNVCTGSGLGVVNTAGTVVTAVSGPTFIGAAGTIQINGTPYRIQTVVSSTILVLTSSAGTQTGATSSTLSGCLAALATTYTTANAGTPCPTTAQLVPLLGGSCTATTDNQGNLNFWALPGAYFYYLTVPASAGGQSIGPYPLSIGASVGCPLGWTCDSNYTTLPLAIAAAGSGQLYITKGWAVTGSSATIALPLTVTCAPGTGIITSALSTATITITAGATVNGCVVHNTGSGSAIAVTGATGATLNSVTTAASAASTGTGVLVSGSPGFTLNGGSHEGHFGALRVGTSVGSGDNWRILNATFRGDGATGGTVWISTDTGSNTLSGGLFTGNTLNSYNNNFIFESGEFGGGAMTDTVVTQNHTYNLSGGTFSGCFSLAGTVDTNPLLFGNDCDGGGFAPTVGGVEFGAGNDQRAIGNQIKNIGGTGGSGVGIVKDGTGKGFKTIANTLEGPIEVYSGSGTNDTISDAESLGDTVYSDAASSGACVIDFTNGPGAQIIRHSIIGEHCYGIGSGVAFQALNDGTSGGQSPLVDSTYIDGNQIYNYGYLAAAGSAQTNTAIGTNYLHTVTGEISGSPSGTDIIQYCDVTFTCLIDSTIQAKTFISSNGAPSCTPEGGLGSGGTCVVVSSGGTAANAMSFVLLLTAGTSPSAAPAEIALLTWSPAWASTVLCHFQAAFTGGGTSQIYEPFMPTTTSVQVYNFVTLVNTDGYVIYGKCGV